jgi:pyruvyltransferase
MTKIKVYVWDDVPNWGDQLGFHLFKHFLGHLNVQQVNKIGNADIVGIGSTISHIPSDWSGVIAGSGLLKPRQWKTPNARIVGVRGKLTMANSNNLHPGFVGDPALITPDVINPEFAPYYDKDPHGRADIGVLPHWSDTALKYDSRFLGPWKTKLISPFQHPYDVIRQIMSCDKLVTSSLHGTIIADAYGIPRRIVPSWTMLNSPYEGGMFKFEDYMSALDMSYHPEVLEKADQTTVAKVQNDIFNVYLELRSNLLPSTFFA